MVENNFAQLDLLESVCVDEVEQHTLGGSMELWENDDFPPSESELQSPKSDFLPAACNGMVHADPDFGR